LLSFIGDAYLNEMGVTNRLRPKDTTLFRRRGSEKVALRAVDPPN